MVRDGLSGKWAFKSGSAAVLKVPQNVVMWDEFGKDLSKTLENGLIVFLSQGVRNVKTNSEARRMKQKQVFALDLTKIDGSGDLSCPRCGAAISPDDCTEEAYSIMETKVNSQGLEEVVIRCNRCTSRIHLTGFAELQELEMAEEKRRNDGESPVFYVNHV